MRHRVLRQGEFSHLSDVDCARIMRAALFTWRGFGAWMAALLIAVPGVVLALLLSDIVPPSVALVVFVLVAAVFLLSAIALSSTLVGPVIERLARHHHPRCPACNYSLHANTSGTCSECGSRVA